MHRPNKRSTQTATGALSIALEHEDQDWTIYWHDAKSIHHWVWARYLGCKQLGGRVHEVACCMLKQVWVHAARLSLVLVLFATGLTYVAYLHPSQITAPLAVGLSVSFAAYIVVHNCYFAFLQGKLRAKSCFQSRSDGLQSLGIAFTVSALILHSLLYLVAFFGLSCEDSDSWAVGIFMAFGISIQLVADTCLFHILFGLILVLGLLTACLLYLICRILGLCYFCCCMGCAKPSKERLQEVLKERILHLVQQYAVLHDESCPAALCSICFDQIAYGTRAIHLDCNTLHMFHTHCLAEWLMASNACPLCRTAILPPTMHSRLF